MKLETIRDDYCYCCGEKNPQGLKLIFTYPEPGTAETSCKIPSHFTGWQNLTHGGLLAMLLDETMAHACISEAGMGVTAEITVRYRHPIQVGKTVRIAAEVKTRKSRILETEGWIRDGEGNIVADAKARFLITSH